MIYDAHNHLQDERLTPCLRQVLEEMERVPVACCVVNGTRESDWPAVLELSRRKRWIIPSLGLHPWHVKNCRQGWQQRLETLIVQNDCAVGEIGLDRWVEGYDLAVQEPVFVQQLEIASRFNRPVSIHCLKAFGRLREILEAEARPGCGFLLHSYGGPMEMVSQFAELGGYFSLSGHFAHERKEKQREVFRRIPRERLLLETDAPDMLPPTEYCQHLLEGGLNHPANIAAVYRFAATLLSIDREELAEQVEANFRRVFGPMLSGRAP